MGFEEEDLKLSDIFIIPYKKCILSIRVAAVDVHEDHPAEVVFVSFFTESYSSPNLHSILYSFEGSHYMQHTLKCGELCFIS